MIRLFNYYSNQIKVTDLFGAGGQTFVGSSFLNAAFLLFIFFPSVISGSK